MPVANRYIRCNKTQVSESVPFGPLAGLYPAILEKGTWPNLGEIINYMSKLGKINDIKHNNGSKIYPKNQAFFSLLYMPSTSIILIWVIVVVVSVTVSKKK